METEKDFQIGQIVCLTSDPTKQGAVVGISGRVYSVFIGNEIHTFYREQIQATRQNEDKERERAEYPMAKIRAALTAFQIHNPGSNTLYSLNAARIDFVPYQFRPALKMIHATEPRVLVADDVGVGKTIEAGLILKEMEARDMADSVLVICPRPLVAENKWQDEMKRFDENFTQLDGKIFAQCISDTERDGEWPEIHKKTVIPYSLFNEDTIMGLKSQSKKRKKDIGLSDLDPFPHFDLVIVDEAHTIRNPDTWMYMGVSLFCQNADAVVLLTATPVQNSNDDLFTLLNLLRPDIVVDKDTFNTMAEPNRYINQLLKTVRRQKEGWQQAGLKELDYILDTKWGYNVIQKNPVYLSVRSILSDPDITQEQRILLIKQIESLHSFHEMINRTRRKDIEDFCIRRTETIKVKMSESQAELYQMLFEFEHKSLELIHGDQNTYFMMCTILRQASSCIYGLAPFIEDIINKRLDEIRTDGGYLDEDFDVRVSDDNRMKELADEILERSKRLPKEDPKYDQLVMAIRNKQQEENNKVIVFSSFRHTLTYLRKRLEESGIRVGQVDGSVSDDERTRLRDRFKMSRRERNALDVLLFSEVGSEGLDYQFCDTIINYDLPWNPMRIEQRIGRIDRRGQKSDTVLICNLVSEGTIDENVYDKCLMKIGVFESSIGDCSEILGTVGRSIFNIMFDRQLSEEEKDLKMQQLADNKIRKVQELNSLEEEEKSIYGIDISENMKDQEVRDSESTWINPQTMQELLTVYLCDNFGDGEYFKGKGERKVLNLSVDKRGKLRKDMIDLFGKTPRFGREDIKWRSYLKSGESRKEVTFSSDYAREHRQTTFLTQFHPFVRQAAEYECSIFPLNIMFEAQSDGTIPAGEYEFQIYSWNYVGLRPDSRLVAVSADSQVEKAIFHMIQSSDASVTECEIKQEKLLVMQDRHYQRWRKEHDEYVEGVRKTCYFRLDQIKQSHNTHLLAVDEQLRRATDERIIRMRQSQKENIERRFNEQVKNTEDAVKRADIHSELLVNGIMHVD